MALKGHTTTHNGLRRTCDEGLADGGWARPVVEQDVTQHGWWVDEHQLIALVAHDRPHRARRPDDGSHRGVVRIRRGERRLCGCGGVVVQLQAVQQLDRATRLRRRNQLDLLQAICIALIRRDAGCARLLTPGHTAMVMSNSPHPVSVTSNGGELHTRKGCAKLGCSPKVTCGQRA
jgi:hypothetical protein